MSFFEAAFWLAVLVLAYDRFLGWAEKRNWLVRKLKLRKRSRDLFPNMVGKPLGRALRPVWLRRGRQIKIVLVIVGAAIFLVLWNSYEAAMSMPPSP